MQNQHDGFEMRTSSHVVQILDAEREGEWHLHYFNSIPGNASEYKY